MIIQNAQSVIWTGWSDLRISRLQSGLFRKPLSSTPEPGMSLVLRSRYLRWEGLDFRAEVRRSQLVTDKLQLTNLNKEQWRSKCIYLQFHESLCHCGSVDTHCPSVEPGTDLRTSSLQFGLFSPVQSCFIPESCSSLWLRFSSLRLEGLNSRAEATTSQWLSERKLLESLQQRRGTPEVTLGELLENIFVQGWDVNSDQWAEHHFKFTVCVCVAICCFCYILWSTDCLE